MCVKRSSQRNKSDFDEKKWIGYWAGLGISGGFWIYLHNRAFQDNISISKGTTSISLSPKEENCEKWKSFSSWRKSTQTGRDPWDLRSLCCRKVQQNYKLKQTQHLNFINIYLSMFWMELLLVSTSGYFLWIKMEGFSLFNFNTLRFFLSNLFLQQSQQVSWNKWRTSQGGSKGLEQS